MNIALQFHSIWLVECSSPNQIDFNLDAKSFDIDACDAFIFLTFIFHIFFRLFFFAIWKSVILESVSIDFFMPSIQSDWRASKCYSVRLVQRWLRVWPKSCHTGTLFRWVNSFELRRKRKTEQHRLAMVLRCEMKRPKQWRWTNEREKKWIRKECQYLFTLVVCAKAPLQVFY